MACSFFSLSLSLSRMGSSNHRANVRKDREGRKFNVGRRERNDISHQVFFFFPIPSSSTVQSKLDKRISLVSSESIPLSSVILISSEFVWKFNFGLRQKYFYMKRYFLYRVFSYPALTVWKRQTLKLHFWAREELKWIWKEGGEGRHDHSLTKLNIFLNSFPLNRKPAKTRFLTEIL